MVTEAERAWRREYMRQYRASTTTHASVAQDNTRARSMRKGVLGSKWNATEDALLASMIGEGYTHEHVARALDRSVAAVAARRKRLGLTGANSPVPTGGN